MFKKIFFILSMVLTISLVPKHLMTAEAAKCSTKQECKMWVDKIAVSAILSISEIRLGFFIFPKRLSTFS